MSRVHDDIIVFSREKTMSSCTLAMLIKWTELQPRYSGHNSCSPFHAHTLSDCFTFSFLAVHFVSISVPPFRNFSLPIPMFLFSHSNYIIPFYQPSSILAFTHSVPIHYDQTPYSIPSLFFLSVSHSPVPLLPPVRRIWTPRSSMEPPGSVSPWYMTPVA